MGLDTILPILALLNSFYYFNIYGKIILTLTVALSVGQAIVLSSDYSLCI